MIIETLCEQTARKEYSNALRDNNNDYSKVRVSAIRNEGQSTIYRIEIKD